MPTSIAPVTRPLALLILVLLIGCGPSRTPSASTPFTLTTAGDTTIAWSTVPARPDTALLVPDLLIGVEEGEEAFMFSGISALSVDSAGNIHVVDGSSSTIRVFGPDGTFLRRFGGAGAGPGEFRYATAVAIHGDGRILVPDGANRRINLYTPEGTPVAHWSLAGYQFRSDPPLRPLPDGFTLVAIQPEGSNPWPSPSFLRFSPDGSVQDTIDTPPGQAESCPATLYDGPQPRPVVHTPTLTVVPGRDGGLVIGCNREYVFHVGRSDGTVLRIGRDWEPVPVGPAEQEFWTRGITAQFRQRNPDWRWTAPPVPEHKPAWRQILVGSDGRYWVKTSQPSTSAPAPEHSPAWWPEIVYTSPVGYDQFDTTGRWLAVVRVPPGFREYPTPFFRGDTAWAVVTDSLGVERVARMHLSALH